MTRTLNVVLVTVGDPGQVSGGYFYHRQMAVLAAENAAHVQFSSLPSWPFPLPLFGARQVMRRAAAKEADAVVIDSLAAAFAAPFVRASRPMVASVHQPPGGMGHARLRRRLQRRLDLRLYRN